MTIDINELRRKLQSDDFIDRIDIHANVKPVLTELLDRLEAAENDSARHKALAESALRVAKGWEDKCDELRAKIESMERQEPLCWAQIDELEETVSGVLGFECPPYYTTPLYLASGAQPAPSFADAYQGAMEDVAIWKKRALEAEYLNRKFVAEINGPAYMGEPAQPAQPAPSVPTALLVAVANLVAQMEIVSRVGFVDTPNDKDSCAAFCVAEGTWLELMSAVESLASALAAAPEAKP